MPNILAIAGSSSKYKQPDANPAGFVAGFWHGLILPITFIVSIFNSGVRIYETHNRGRLYDLGFLFGAGCSLGGSGRETAEYTNPAA